LLLYKDIRGTGLFEPETDDVLTKWIKFISTYGAGVEPNPISLRPFTGLDI
jgi:hypothetical protein